MSKNSFFTCDYCLKNTAEMFEMPEAWLMAGTWTERSNVDRIEIYLSSDAQEKADPDQLWHFCSVDCLLECIRKLLPGGTANANSASRAGTAGGKI